MLAFHLYAPPLYLKHEELSSPVRVPLSLPGITSTCIGSEADPEA